MHDNVTKVQIGVQGSSVNRGLLRLLQQPKTIATLMLVSSEGGTTKTVYRSAP